MGYSRSTDHRNCPEESLSNPDLRQNSRQGPFLAVGW